MAQSPAPRHNSFQRSRLSALHLAAQRTQLFNSISKDFLQEYAQRVLKETAATGVAIALEHQGELFCRAIAGESTPESGARIDSGSGLTGVCIYTGAMQLCSNTELDSRVDPDICRTLGVRAMVVVPLLQGDQFIGLIEVFSRRPYAFGMQHLQKLQNLAEKFVSEVQGGSTVCVDPLDGAQDAPDKEKTQTLRGWLRSLGKARFSLLCVLTCSLLLLLAWRWAAHGIWNRTADTKVELLSVVRTPSTGGASAEDVQGMLIRRVDPLYPAEALRQHEEGKVVLQIQVACDGHLVNAIIVNGAADLSRAVMEAVQMWRFRPFHVDATSPNPTLQITYEFKHAQQGSQRRWDPTVIDVPKPSDNK